MNTPTPGPSRLPSQHDLGPPQSPESGPSTSSISLNDVKLSAHLDQEIGSLIAQWLETRAPRAARAVDEDLFAVETERDEGNVEVERAILDGDYASLESVLNKPGLLKPQAQKSFLYLCYRQQFLEFIENRESQKAFNLLSKRLKPLEHYQPTAYDFYNLSYLTSASTVHDAPGLRDWAGEGPERERLVDRWRELVASEGDMKTSAVDTAARSRSRVSGKGRLEELLQQAVAWQVGKARRKGEGPWTISTLMRDYQPLVVPTRLLRMLPLHTSNIKCLDYLGSSSNLAVSGSSDSTLQVFSTLDGSIRHTFAGHTSRIWTVSTSPSSSTLASGSGDGSVRIWSVAGAGSQGDCLGVMNANGGDVYSVRWRPNREDQVVSASYDRILRVWDVEIGRPVRTFSGHSQSTLSVAYDQNGTLLASGSKDKHIRLWDAVGGACVHTMTDSLGEITSVEFDREGKYLLAGCKDNSNRLFDLRMQRNLYRYTGHQNTSKNLIRASFAANDSLVVSGSEDGMVYIWEREIARASPASVLNQANSVTTTTTSNTNVTAPPAYYPPRDLRTTAKQNTWGTNVRPLRVLEGHGPGAVFDVMWAEDGILSAGEDGAIGVWGVEDDED